MAGLYDLIPGLREAEDGYRREQSEAFSFLEPKICGLVELRPFTPMMFIHLEGIESPFFRSTGKMIDEVDICLFLWRCSTCYVADDEALRRYFISNLAMLDYNDVQLEIFAYVKRAWAGMPQWPGAGRGGQGVAQWPSRLVDMLGSEYGWSEEYILNLPFRRLWQYANRILERKNPKYREQCAAALKLRGDWLAAQNAAAAAGGRSNV
jgi:hypothetical protein